MKPLPPSWSENVRLARTEPVPPVDLNQLLRVVRGMVPATVDWRFEFERVFARRFVFTGCAVAAVMLLGVTGWQAWTFWQDVLPWAQLLAAETMANGGAS